METPPYMTLVCTACGATHDVTELSEPLAWWFDRHRPCMTGEPQEIDRLTKNVLDGGRE